MPADTVHLPGWIDSEWVEQLVAGQLVTVKTKRGFQKLEWQKLEWQKLEWQKLRDRTEALDCRVYARAAGWIAGTDRSDWRGGRQRNWFNR